MLRAQTIKKDNFLNPRFWWVYILIFISDICKKDGKIFTKASEIVFIKEYLVIS